MGEAQRQDPEHEAAGYREPERQAERASGGVHPGGFADPLLGDGGQGEVVELGHQRPSPEPAIKSGTTRYQPESTLGTRGMMAAMPMVLRAKPEQHDIGWTACARFATGEQRHSEHGERKRCEGKPRFHCVVLQCHLQEERQGDHGAAEGDLLEHLLGDADAEVQVLEQVGIQKVGFPRRLRWTSQYANTARATAPMAMMRPT